MVKIHFFQKVPKKFSVSEENYFIVFPLLGGVRTQSGIFLEPFPKGSLQKKVWNIPYFSRVGGFEKVIFHKKIKIKKMV